MLFFTIGIIHLSFFTFDPGVGILYFKRGKATSDMPMLVSGIALLVYPYFITDTLYIVVVGLALTALPWAQSYF